ncbi:hypothetical protein [Caldalkalibacillus mannanilyticus]|uniref:hypothetical protein n=1 Tax=Caldalkalibacillus mannanilyticus TaxID=1418 RepID=UPI0034E2D734
MSRQLFYNLLIQDFMENPRTIVLSTHLIDEVSKIFEKIIIIDQGKLLLLEEVEGLRTKAFHLSGEHHKLDSFVQGKEIIHTESFGNQEVIGILGNISAEERKRAEELEVKIDVIPIQQLMIYLTTKPSKMHGFKKGEV